MILPEIKLVAYQSIRIVKLKTFTVFYGSRTVVGRSHEWCPLYGRWTGPLTPLVIPH